MFSIYYKSQTQPDGGEGCSGMATGSPVRCRPTEVGYRKRMGRRTEIELGVPAVGTSPQHRIKSSIHHDQVCILGARVRKDVW